MPSLVAQAAAPYLGAVLLRQGGAGLTLGVLAVLAAFNVALVLLLRLVLGPRRTIAGSSPVE